MQYCITYLPTAYELQSVERGFDVNLLKPQQWQDDFYVFLTPAPTIAIRFAVCSFFAALDDAVDFVSVENPDTKVWTRRSTAIMEEAVISSEVFADSKWGRVDIESKIKPCFHFC